MQNTLKPINSPDGLFHDGNPTTGELGTIVSADWLNSLQLATAATQDELIALIKDSGQELDASRKDQLLQAVKKMAWGGNSKPTTLAGYGITDGATKAEVSIKADKAGTLAGYGIADGATTSQLRAAAPAGEVAYFAMPSAPPGWLKCDGSSANRNAYPALFEAIGTRYGAGDGTTTFNLPDLRGEFIRGWSSDRPLVDAGRVFGSAQISTQVWVDDDANEAVGAPDWTNNNLVNLGYEPASVNVAHLHYAKSVGSASYGADFIRSIRPRNLALLACIKY
ncbi:phage tail protein [Chromobacterium haemolyticum]|uniref:phage tail protein n=1 Tax=Chromobacterium haemolyticum TaxID=394935 RepID=UPI001B3B8555|nr:phage tail protein [Chromobacterium haemolyticum]